jgi:hypothetical protein
MSGADAPSLMNMVRHGVLHALQLLPPLRLYGIMALRRQLVQLNPARGGAGTGAEIGGTT